MKSKLTEVFSHFGLNGSPEDIREIKTGHINQTCVASLNGKKYTVQTINTYVFPHPYEVMENILSVTDYLRAKTAENGGDTEREVLHFYRTEDGKGCWKDGDGKFWRIYDYIDRAVSYDIADNLQVLTDAALAFGTFQKLLADFPGSQLHETIVDFHNTEKRFANLEQGILRDAAGRAGSVPEEIEFFRSRGKVASYLTDRIKSGELPLRVTHNDTKFNNILIDAETGKPLCVIDLDTIMPGLAAYDFGDAIRFCTNSAAEDEPDLSKVRFCIDKFDAFTKGFIGGADGFFSEAEVDSMAWGALLMTLETGSRFLLDYLDGDCYFHTEYPEHNLVRARTQMQLALQMEQQFDAMQEIVHRYASQGKSN